MHYHPGKTNLKHTPHRERSAGCEYIYSEIRLCNFLLWLLNEMGAWLFQAGVVSKLHRLCFFEIRFVHIFFELDQLLPVTVEAYLEVWFSELLIMLIKPKVCNACVETWHSQRCCILFGLLLCPKGMKSHYVNGLELYKVPTTYVTSLVFAISGSWSKVIYIVDVKPVQFKPLHVNGVMHGWTVFYEHVKIKGFSTSFPIC